MSKLTGTIHEDLRTLKTVKGKGKNVPVTDPVWPKGWVEV